MIRQCLSRHIGKCEVYSESMTNFCSSIQFFVRNATISR